MQNKEYTSMTRPNPMSGPAYVMALRNALEKDKRPSQYDYPPRGGGIQISVRLEEFLYNHVNAIVEKSGWNRAEVLTALVQRGLFDLYENSHPDTVDAIVEKVVAKLAPSHNAPRGWYVDIWDKGGTKAKHYEVLADFAATLAYIKAFKAKKTDETLRIVNPSDATDEQLQELMKNGATIP
jgi:hypothetical protein